MNRVILIGNVASDPEARTTSGGINCSQFRLAVQRNHKNQSGTYDSDFFPVVAWRKTADFCNTYLTKGRKVAISGSIQTRSYDAQDGGKRWVTEVIADSVEPLTPAHPRDDGRPAEAPNAAPEFPEVDPGDDLPF